MAVSMGPMLSFRGYGADGRTWRLTAIVVADSDPGDLTLPGGSAAAEPLWSVKGRTAYRYAFALALTDANQTVAYALDGAQYEVALPAAGASPNMAYTSCNGFSSQKLIKGVKDPNVLWRAMRSWHGLPPGPGDEDAIGKKWPKISGGPAPYHLLLLGGDQVYADEMWELKGPMKDWLARSWDDGNKAAPNQAMVKFLEEFYFDLYRKRWAQPGIRDMLARVPSIAMWDDHDLMDGWGSYPAERQNCKVFAAVWQSASKAFRVFQQHLGEGELRPGAIGNALPGVTLPVTEGAFSFGYVVGQIAILAIDMRSQRNEKDQVVGKAHWAEIYAWIDALAPPVAHLVVMSSIPVVYPGFDTIEQLLGIYPGHLDIEDDLRDHWNSEPHRGERTRLVQRLLGVRNEIKPLIVSGDVHVAALGVIESTRPQSRQTSINQLISSGIVHPGPGAVILLALRNLFDSDQEIERGVVGRMVKFPNSAHKFLGARNFLSLKPDPEAERPRLWANWILENTEFPITKVIEPNRLSATTAAR